MELTVLEWASEVWRSWGEPVNVIEDGRVPGRDAGQLAKDIRAELSAVTAGEAGYRWSLVGNRYVLYPRDAVWDTVITGVHLNQTPRFEAAIHYVEIARAQVPALAGVVGPILKGDPGAPVYIETVSLSEEASIVEHLVQLLGGAADLAFVIERTRDGRRVLHFERVPAKEGAGLE